MSQNQNRIINQFLQGKSSSHNNYVISNNNKHYFSKDIKNTRSKIIAPNFISLNDDFYNHDKNNLKISYNENKNYRNYYKVNNHNHSVYITNNSSDFIQKNIMQRRDMIKTPEIKTKDFQHSANCKTDNNYIRRANSSINKNRIQIETIKNNDKKKYNTYKQERRTIEIIHQSPSQPE